MDDQRADPTRRGGVELRRARMAWSVAWGALFAFLLADVRGAVKIKHPSRREDLPVFMVLALLIAAPWIARRYTIRSLLVAIAMVSVVLVFLLWVTK